MALITTIAIILSAALVKWVKDIEADIQDHKEYQEWTEEMYNMWSVE
tara:strand:+ start:2256 stop:2396 length:141 start_codon:yes stop_codon:yes gene_type:complete